VAGRDSQDVSLPVTQPTTAAARDSQDVVLPVTGPSTAKARDSQDVVLPITGPSTASARNSQDLLLFLMAFLGARDSQDVVLPVNQPSTALARLSQDVLLYIQTNAPPAPPVEPCYGYYTSLITSQYQNSPAFLAWLASNLQFYCDIMACTDSMNQKFSVATAVGAQLDTLGLIIGVSRMVQFQPTGGISPMLSDSNYRILLKATIIQNQFNGQYMGTNSTLWDDWQGLFPGGSIYVIDNQNMTVTVIVSGGFTPIMQQLILNGYIVPQAEAVMFNYIFATLPVFGFDGVNPAIIAGFDVGHFG
jgi:hypothetical protein